MTKESNALKILYITDRGRDVLLNLTTTNEIGSFWPFSLVRTPGMTGMTLNGSR